MPGRKAKDKRASDYFRFAVEAWGFDYGFHVQPDYKEGDPLSRCWESCEAVISGTMRSRTRWRCGRVKLTVSPEAFDDLKNWPPARRGFGWIDGIRAGALTGRLWLPTQSFQTLLAAMAATKVRGLYVGVGDIERGGGKITSFFTVDPDEPDE